MNRKKLPISIPPIIGYVIHAFPLSIILNYNKCLPWFFSNYIQLSCNTQFKNNFFDFFALCPALEGIPWIDSIYPGIPWINRHSIDGHTFIECNLDINKIIINSLSRNNYIVCHLDEFFVPNSSSYQNGHFFHENLIYGYDMDKMTYDILGFDKHRKFAHNKISFQAFKQASENHDIKFLRINDEFSFELDLKFIRDLLLDYLYSENSSDRLRMIKNPTKNCVYGMSVYKELIQYFTLLSEDSVDFDIRPLHILWEHKKCMRLRIEFISKNYESAAAGLEETFNEYSILEQRCLSIRNLLIKYLIRKHPANIEKIISSLNYISNVEQKTVRNFIAKIEGLL